jgi:hypothetical protein
MKHSRHSGGIRHLLWLLILFQGGCLSEQYSYFDGELSNLDGSGSSLTGRSEIGGSFGNRNDGGLQVHGVALPRAYLTFIYHSTPEDPWRRVRNETLEEVWLVTGTTMARINGAESGDFARSFVSVTAAEREAMPGVFRLRGDIDVKRSEADEFDVRLDLRTDEAPPRLVRGRLRFYERLHFRPMRWLAYLFMALS